SQLQGLKVYFKNLFPTDQVRLINGNLAVKASGAQQRGIQDVRSICSRHDDDSRIGTEAVHFHQQLVERVLPFIVATHDTVFSKSTTDCIDLINKVDTGSLIFRLAEQVPYTR